MVQEFIVALAVFEQQQARQGEAVVTKTCHSRAL